MSITFGSGVTLGAGVTASGGGVGFTISPSDFTQKYYGGGVVPIGASDGFTNNGTQGPGYNFYGPNLGALNGAPSPAKLNELINYFTANGLDTNNGASYIFNVTWGPGSAPQSDKVVLALYANADYAVLDIGTVYTGNNNWETGGQDIYNSGSNPSGLISAQGTYNFPATFTLYQPLITNNASWC